MKEKYILMALLGGTLMMTGCDDFNVVEKEQYKQVFAFVSDADHFSDKMVSFDSLETTGYISISVGGTKPTDRDIHINIAEDVNVLKDYNAQTYDVNIEKYAHLLPSYNYTIGSLQCTVKAGDIRGDVPITIRPANLSPDTTYIVPFRISSYDYGEANPGRNYLLYRIRTRNKWCKGDGTSSYTMTTSRRVVGDSTWINMPGSKVLYPIAKNIVRTMAANEDFSSNKHNLDTYGIYITIGDDNKLTLTPCRDLELEQIMPNDSCYDAEYPNTYSLDNSGYVSYHTFLLHYRYKSNGEWYEIKEELRMQNTENN